jgi:hypothetical protein
MGPGTGRASGKRDSQVIEELLRRDLGLDLLERLWHKNGMNEDDAMGLAIELSTERGAPPEASESRTRPHRPDFRAPGTSRCPRSFAQTLADGDFELVLSGNPGDLLQRLVSEGRLTSPWAVTLSPVTFGAFGGDILVGNFGDGQGRRRVDRSFT